MKIKLRKTTKPQPAEGGDFLRRLVQRRKVRFWGQESMITPRLLNWIEGDGLQVIFFTPLATRPNYYVVRIDSKTDLDADEFYDGTREEIYDELEEQFGRAHEEWEADNGRSYERHNYWPAFDYSCGCSWGSLDDLTTPDKRTEREIRAEITASWKTRRSALNAIAEPRPKDSLPTKKP